MTVKEVAEALHISKQGAMGWLKKLPEGTLTKDPKGCWCCPDDTLELLQQLGAKLPDKKKGNTPQNNDTADVLRATLEVLQGQLAEKDKQIAELQKSLNQALAEVQNEQLLNATNLKQLSDGSDESKKNWWQRIFGK